MNQPAQPPPMDTVAVPPPPATPAPALALAPVVARLSKITLSDYRAFPAGQNYEFDLGPEGKNLLLFGENGSGKSSLFQALRDLTSRSPDIMDFKTVRHIYAPGEEGFISVQLTAGTPSEFRWDYGETHPAGTAGQPFLLLADRCRFLDYKALLETNFVHRTHKPDLFGVLIGNEPDNVLRDLPVIVDGRSTRLGLVYRQMIERHPGSYNGKRKIAAVDKACEDFNAALTNHLPEVVAVGRQLIVKMGIEGMEFDLIPGVVSYNQHKREFVGSEIGLKVKLFGQPIDHPQLFLNESRLTALALAIYLGAANLVLKSAEAGSDGTIKVRLLVLDDVLIGLDLSNRLPVLKVLNEDFTDWQIILMTYDRVWFELAKEFTEHTDRWTTLNLRELPTVPGQPGRPHVEPCPDLLAIAATHLQARDLMAAAVYIRAAFETRLKNVCEKNGIKIKYKHDPKEVKSDQLWQGIVERQKERQSDGKSDFINPALMNDVETIRSTVLNRLSHAGVPALVTKEVQFALETIRKLQNHQFDKACKCQHMTS